MDGPALVFVYGLLMKGEPLHAHLAGAQFVARARVAGTLWSLGTYPGLTDGSGDARGELYRLDDPATALDVLDDVEEYDPSDPARSLYVRSIRRATTEAGAQLDAWVYLYNASTASAQRIASGDWRSYRPER